MEAGGIMGLTDLQKLNRARFQAVDETRNGNGNMLIMQALLEKIRAATKEAVKEALAELRKAEAETQQLTEAQTRNRSWINSFVQFCKNVFTQNNKKEI